MDEGTFLSDLGPSKQDLGLKEETRPTPISRVRDLQGKNDLE